MESTNLQPKDDESSDKTDASSTVAALAMMQQELPQYLQNMLFSMWVRQVTDYCRNQCECITSAK